jgi:hypothetical protein
MFRKKKIKCMGCGKKIEKKFDFCPYCGHSMRGKEEFKDFQKEFEKAIKMPFFVKFPFRQLMKQFEKQIGSQMREYDKGLENQKKSGKVAKEIRKIPISGLSISIGGSGTGKPVIKIKQVGKPEMMKIMTARSEENTGKLTREKIKKEMGKLSKIKARKFAKLPKTEPETKVRRLTDKIVYEIALPGVKSVKDIIIHKLENSIEIKAFAKDKAYFKLIPIALPMKRYKLEKEILILELVP